MNGVVGKEGKIDKGREDRNQQGRRIERIRQKRRFRLVNEDN